MYDIKEGFLRQRRNLMAITIAIFLSYFWEVDFKTINILGNEANLKQGSNVYGFLWILLLYWSWRYRNYLRELGQLGIVKTLGDSRYRFFKSWLDHKGSDSAFWVKANYEVQGQGQFDATDLDKIRIDPPQIKFSQRSVKLLISYVENPQPWRGDNVTINFVMSRWRLLVINYKALSYLINDTRLFSEYILPPLLVLLFVIYWFWQEFGTILLNN